MTATLTASRPIRQLPLELANQIAAGEVVERPASVVKELIENSLDAGATRIEISISRGGLQAITLRDNGFGIPREQLPLAISRHATSKINSLAELENIHSLGFRGEALASIGSVSRMQLISCCSESREAWQIDCASNDLSVQAAAHPTGTSVIVQDLFYNTPARRKFMRSEKTEFRHIDEVVRRLALSNFAVGFGFKHNERLVYQFAPADNAAACNRRVAKLCGKAFMDQAVQVDFQAHGLRLWGWVSGPDFSRSQNDLQYFYVNGRIIRDRLINHAIRQVYQAWIHPGRHAAYLLHFDIDPTAVDVNVHPTKHEVRFREARLVHDFIHRSLREALSGKTTTLSSVPAAGQYPWQADYQPQGYVAAGVAESAPSFDLPLGQARALLHNRFIIAENRQGLALVDGRRAQQQLIYRKLSTAMTTEGINSRPLLIPKSISVGREQAAVAESSQPILQQLGFDLNCTSPGSVLLRMIPVVLAGAELESLVGRLLGQLRGRADQALSLEGDSELLQELAEGAAQSQIIDSAIENLDRLLREIEGLQDNTLWRSFDAVELQQLLDND